MRVFSRERCYLTRAPRRQCVSYYHETTLLIIDVLFTHLRRPSSQFEHQTARNFNFTRCSASCVLHDETDKWVTCTRCTASRLTTSCWVQAWCAKWISSNRKQPWLILSAFTKLRKATNSIVCLSVRPHGKNSVPTGWNFIWVFSENLSRKIKFR
jgi:hypothetical protein